MAIVTINSSNDTGAGNGRMMVLLSSFSSTIDNSKPDELVAMSARANSSLAMDSEKTWKVLDRFSMLVW